MPAPRTLPCPKCGGVCHGPYYERVTNELRYRCACGYETYLPALDDMMQACKQEQP